MCVSFFVGIIPLFLPLFSIQLLSTPRNLFVGAVEIDYLIDGIRQTLDGMETEEGRFRWDENGPRLEKKSWGETMVDLLNKGLYTNDGLEHRGKRAATNENKGNDLDEEKLVQMNLRYVVFKSGTRMVDIQNGLRYLVNPDGQIQIDYRNGTVRNYIGNDNGSGGNSGVAVDRRSKRAIAGTFDGLFNNSSSSSSSLPNGVLMIFRQPKFDFIICKNGTYKIDVKEGALITFIPRVIVDYRNGTVKEFKNGEEFLAAKKAAAAELPRTKRFATLDDMYMAHGYELKQRDAKQFGEGQQASVRSEGDTNAGNDDGWKWTAPKPAKEAQTEKDKSAASSAFYWNKALYEGSRAAGQQQAEGPAKPAQQQHQMGAFDNSGSATNDNDGGNVHPPSASPPPLNAANSMEQMPPLGNQSMSKQDNIAYKLLAELELLPPVQVAWNSATKEVFIRNLAGLCLPPIGEQSGLEKVLRKLLNQPAPKSMFEWAQPAK